MSEEDEFVRITLRIPKKIHEALNEAAAKKRSMNAEIISRLEQTFEAGSYSAYQARQPVDTDLSKAQHMLNELSAMILKADEVLKNKK